MINFKKGRTIMLVLSRRVGESIVINGEIEITVLGVRGNQVKLGTTAPKAMKVNRAEIESKQKAEEKSGEVA